MIPSIHPSNKKLLLHQSIIYLLQGDVAEAKIVTHPEFAKLQSALKMIESAKSTVSSQESALKDQLVQFKKLKDADETYIKLYDKCKNAHTEHSKVLEDLRNNIPDWWAICTTDTPECELKKLNDTIELIKVNLVKGTDVVKQIIKENKSILKK